jgi:hypothetical protein
VTLSIYWHLLLSFTIKPIMPSVVLLNVVVLSVTGLSVVASLQSFYISLALVIISAHRMNLRTVLPNWKALLVRLG